MLRYLWMLSSLFFYSFLEELYFYYFLLISFKIDFLLDWSSSDEFENSAEKSQFCTRLEELDLKLGKVFQL